MQSNYSHNPAKFKNIQPYRNHLVQPSGDPEIDQIIAVARKLYRETQGRQVPLQTHDYPHSAYQHPPAYEHPIHRQPSSYQPSYQPSYQHQVIDVAHHTMPPTTKPVVVPQLETSFVQPQHSQDEKATQTGWAIALGTIISCATLVTMLLFVPQIFKSKDAESKHPAPTTTKVAAKKLLPTPKVGDKIGNFVVTSAFGMRKSATGGNDTEFHGGVDVAAPQGTPQRMPGELGTQGTVQCKVSANGGGNFADIVSEDPKYAGVHIQLLHLQDNSCISGKHKAGSIIGRVGSTGRSTGPHCHLQIVAYVKKNDNFVRKLTSPSASSLKEVFGILSDKGKENV